MRVGLVDADPDELTRMEWPGCVGQDDLAVDLRRLALAAAARGDLQSARDRFVRVLELDPSLEAARRSLARVEERLGARQPPR